MAVSSKAVVLLKPKLSVIFLTIINPQPEVDTKDGFARIPP